MWWRAKLSLVAAGSDEMIRRASSGSGGGTSTRVTCFTPVGTRTSEHAQIEGERPLSLKLVAFRACFQG